MKRIVSTRILLNAILTIVCVLFSLYQYLVRDDLLYATYLLGWAILFRLTMAEAVQERDRRRDLLKLLGVRPPDQGR